MKTSDENEYEERVKKRVIILKKQFEEGKINIIAGSGIEESLRAVRFTNGQPDLETVDGVVRSMALMAEHFHNRNELRNTLSLQEIQRRYFNYIEANFNSFYKEMQRLGKTPYDVASFIAYTGKDIIYLNSIIDPFLEEIVNFWEAHTEIAFIHLEDNKAIKAIFGGDLFPNENIASKGGIYLDTIIIPCPFIRSKDLFKKFKAEDRVYYLLKHALSLLQYKELALADFDIPIIAIVPDKEMMDKSSYDEVFDLGIKDGLYHASEIFNKQFSETDELFEYAVKLDTIEKVIKEIKNPEKVLFNIENKNSLHEQLLKEINGQTAQILGISNPGIIVANLGFGRMSVCNELLLKSIKFRATPLIDAPTSWEYFKWKLEYDTRRQFNEKDYRNLHIVRALNNLSQTPYRWIGNIPPNALIELRKSGAINEIREILSNGLTEIELSDKLDFISTSDKVFKNIDYAFKQHEINIKKLIEKKWEFADKDISSWLVMGTIEIAAACIGTPLYGISAFALNQLLDPPKLKDIPRTAMELNEEDKKLKKSPIGIIFKYKN